MATESTSPTIEIPEVPAPRAITTADLIDPDAVQGTRFNGPVMSGDPADGMAGIAPLIKRAKFTYKNGSFQVPVKFPASAILLNIYTMIQQSFNGTTPTVSVGLTPGSSTYAGPIALTAAPSLITTAITGLLTSSWTVYISVSAVGATQGNATIMLVYSVPGKALWS